MSESPGWVIPVLANSRSSLGAKTEAIAGVISTSSTSLPSFSTLGNVTIGSDDADIDLIAWPSLTRLSNPPPIYPSVRL